MRRISVGKVEGVVLAAGLSSRSGRFKMTLPLGDRTVIERCIEGMYEIVDRIIVVVGWQAERVRAVLAPYGKVDLVLNERYRDGMFSSVKTGIASVRAPWFFLTPGDLPLIGPQVYERMLDASGEIVIPTFKGRRGHPVLMRSRLVPEILSQSEEANLRQYIDAKGYVTVDVESEGILCDLDTPEDYRALLVRYAGGR